MSSFVLVYFLERSPVGHTFPVGEWPLHATLVPPFESSGKPDFASVTGSHAPIPTTVSGSATFGRRRRPVALLDNPPQLQQLHEDLTAAVGDASGGMVRDAHTG